jgi:hypothetical protein
VGVVTHHAFTDTIKNLLSARFGDDCEAIFENSPLLCYLNLKTKSANSGSKARGAFANHYALYVVIEDYIRHGYHLPSSKRTYSEYEGARFSDLFKRQRELPFGAKLQNHALNARLNDEFEKFFPTLGKTPMVRDVETQRYWIQEDLLQVQIRRKDGSEEHFNIAETVIAIIDAYVATKKAAFEGFIDTCKQIAELGREDPEKAVHFVIEQLKPNVDARIFEIVSYAVLKAKYCNESVWIGGTKDTVEEEELVLYKTGRTNANDGGIDFVMKPLGRFFQVTETADVTKYFLDIDKVQRFPITFVVKSSDSTAKIRNAIREQATAKYRVQAVIESYMNAVEEIINVDSLIQSFRNVVDSGKVNDVMEEIVSQSKVEFNYEEDEELS